MRSLWWVIGAVAVAAVLIVVLRSACCDGRALSCPSQSEQGEDVRQSAIAEVEPDIAETETPAPEDEDGEEPLTEEERAEQEEEKLVDAFDELTDKWMEPSEKGVTMADVDAFVKQFETVPKTRKEECLQRALNLIPDENVMLLVGVLMDKAQDKELVELVFNDILNRDDDVKNPIMRQIFQDKTHPCWADVAWLLDADTTAE